MSISSARGSGRARRRAAIVLITLTFVFIAVSLPYAGRYLAVQDPLERADVIVVLAGAGAERWLEGVDLYNEGWAPCILLSPGRPQSADGELRRRGIIFPTEPELIREAIVRLGVRADAVIVMPRAVDNTADEAAAVRQMAVGAGWRRMLVVTSKYHGRRSRFAFRREFSGTPAISIIVRTSRHDPSTPARWWRRRADIRWVTSELEKLLLYRLGVRD